MPFPARLLADGEEVVLDLRPHWVTLTAPVTLVAGVLVAGGLAWVLAPPGAWRQPLRAGVGVAGLLVLVTLVLPRYLRWLTTHFVVTTDRVIASSGWLRRYSRRVPLERVDGVTFKQSLAERFLGVGDLVIDSSGEQGRLLFANVPDPEGVQAAIYGQLDGGGRRLPGYAYPAPSDGPLDTLERLADLRDRGALSHDEYERAKRGLLGRL